MTDIDVRKLEAAHLTYDTNSPCSSTVYTNNKNRKILIDRIKLTMKF